MLVVDEQQGSERHNDTRQGKGQDIADPFHRRGLREVNAERRNWLLGLGEGAFSGRCSVAGVRRAGWFDEQEVKLIAGNRAMLHFLGDHVDAGEK